MSTEPMTQERLDAIQERVNAATAGLWDWEDNGTLVAWDGYDTEPVIAYGYTDPEDRKLIAHAPQDLADLLAEVQRLKRFESIVSWRYGDTTDGMTREDMVERAARAFYEHPVPGTTGLHMDWDQLTAEAPGVADTYRRHLRAALDAALGTQEGA